MKLPHILAIALAAATLAATTLPASAAWPVVTAGSGASIWQGPNGRGNLLGRVPKGAEVSIDYCTPPDADWCHIIWEDGPNGWVNGHNLRGAAKKRLVTPFLPVFELGWHN